VTAKLAVPSWLKKERLVNRSGVSAGLGCSSSAISVMDLSIFAIVSPSKRPELKTDFHIRNDAFGVGQGA
jgi:hypothetical protein